MEGGHEKLSRAKMAFDEMKDSIGYATNAVRELGGVAKHGFYAARNIRSPTVAVGHAWDMAKSSYRTAKNTGYSVEAGGAAIGNAIKMWRGFGINIEPIITFSKTKGIKKGVEHMGHHYYPPPPHMPPTTPYRGVFEGIAPSTAESAAHFGRAVIRPNGDVVVPNTAHWRRYLAGVGLAGVGVAMDMATRRGGGILIPLAAAAMTMASNRSK